MVQLDGVSSYRPKGSGFDPQSGHMPRLRFQSPFLGAYEGKHINVSLNVSSMFLSLSLSPSLPLSLKSTNMSSGKDYK